MNPDEIRKLIYEILGELRYPVHQGDIPHGTIKQGHIERGALVIFKGVAADRPDGTGEEKAYFATDTDVLSIYNGTAWVSETLT